MANRAFAGDFLINQPPGWVICKVNCLAGTPRKANPVACGIVGITGYESAGSFGRDDIAGCVSGKLRHQSRWLTNLSKPSFGVVAIARRLSSGRRYLGQTIAGVVFVPDLAVQWVGRSNRTPCRIVAETRDPSAWVRDRGQVTGRIPAEGGLSPNTVVDADYSALGVVLVAKLRCARQPLA